MQEDELKCRDASQIALFIPLPFFGFCFACSALLSIALHGLYLFCFVVCIISLSVSLLDISRTLIINYRWPAAIGLVPVWQPAKYV